MEKAANPEVCRLCRTSLNPPFSAHARIRPSNLEEVGKFGDIRNPCRSAEALSALKAAFMHDSTEVTGCKQHSCDQLNCGHAK